jgi:hypothetical protein
MDAWHLQACSCKLPGFWRYGLAFLFFPVSE